MGHNDSHWDPVTQSLRPGLHTASEVAGVVAKEMTREQIESMMEVAYNTLQEKFPMLKGNGFIIIDPRNPRFDGEEFANLQEAKDAASNLAYSSGAGVAIIYAPVLVLRPRRDVAESQPSPLLKQLGLPDGASVGDIQAALPAGEAKK